MVVLYVVFVSARKLKLLITSYLSACFLNISGVALEMLSVYRVTLLLFKK